MSIGGVGRNSRARISSGDRVSHDRELSDRHRDWGDDCPAVDMDFLLCEYNHGLSVAVVDYKFHEATLDKTNARTVNVLSSLYGPDHNQIPFFIARYWSDTWAFKLLAVNEAAKDRLHAVSNGRFRDQWVPLTEQQYVYFLYRLRKDALTRGDQRYLERLNTIMPPREEGQVA